LHVGAGTDASIIGGSTMLVTENGITNLAIRNSANDIELLNYVDSVGGKIGTLTNHPLVVRTNNTDQITILSTGYVGIGTSTPGHRLDVSGNVGAVGLFINGPFAAYFGGTKQQITFDSAGEQGLAIASTNNSTNGGFLSFAYSAVIIGSIKIAGGGTGVSYNTTSDRELKDNLAPYAGSGDVIDATEVYEFTWKNTDIGGVGVIAQEANDVYPEAVTPPGDSLREDGAPEFWMIDYSKYVPVLLAELKALRLRVSALEGA
jgi:hypothetical protein